MGLKGCEITLDNPWNTYYAGQTVNGQVRLTVDSPKKIRGLIVRFLSEANTAWNESRKVTDRDGQERDELVNLTGHEEYFQIQYYLVGGKNSAEIELPSGTHTYPFTCALPPQLPSSFEGEWGHVRYTVKVTLDRPWKFDQESKMAFTVISPVDLNQNPRIKEPYKLELNKTFCCFCCRSGPLSTVVSLPVTGFVSGQAIPIIAECDNASNVGVNSLKLTLNKVVTFTVNTPRADKKKETIKIAEVTVGPIAAHESPSWKQQLDIPALPPSHLSNCGLIDLDYEIKVVLEVQGAHRNLTGTIPIVIGTIPLVSFKSLPPNSAEQTDPLLAGTQSVSPIRPANAGNGGAMGWNLADSGLNSVYPNIPPPSFAESGYKANISDKNDSEHTLMAGGTSQFAPRYPVFQYDASAPPAE